MGLALVVAIATLAVVLALTGSGAAWLSPALVAIALLGAWSGFGWISSPPGIARAIVLAVLLGVLTAVAVTTFDPDSPLDAIKTLRDAEGWDYVWLVAVVAVVVAAGLWALYLIGSLTKGKSLARDVRGWLGYALLVLLATSLVKYAWDRLTEARADGKPAWLDWFGTHEALEVGLVVFVMACLLLPLAEMIAALVARVVAALAVRRR